jgi:hypothetical protein
VLKKSSPRGQDVLASRFRRPRVTTFQVSGFLQPAARPDAVTPRRFSLPRVLAIAATRRCPARLRPWPLRPCPSHRIPARYHPSTKQLVLVVGHRRAGQIQFKFLLSPPSSQSHSMDQQHSLSFNFPNIITKVINFEFFLFEYDRCYLRSISRVLRKEKKERKKNRLLNCRGVLYISFFSV